MDFNSGVAPSYVLVNSQLPVDTGALCVGKLDMGVAPQDEQKRNKTNSSLL